MKKYCCIDFEIQVKLPSTTAPNIRIIKYQSSHPLLKGLTKQFGFCITMGYDKYNILLPKMTISYCPYCGSKLKDFYGSDEYANEIEGETFVTSP
ncbi:hypothetical protein SAMN04515674_1292 [Pseudarcicella hirudinis]|uniref:Uncharacterized protein n=1 Tax=Pseudarcicella hirudinis TaxID=1079859 RepID=A0A1I5Z463_9BACT|nr:hypothetical protein [Pseudarcicella hirudinis]SFQ51264.1 hypothetical protein SAMN04515674_1292 [Pseudarcicella hirudinis]